MANPGAHRHLHEGRGRAGPHDRQTRRPKQGLKGFLHPGEQARHGLPPVGDHGLGQRGENVGMNLCGAREEKLAERRWHRWRNLQRTKDTEPKAERNMNTRGAAREKLPK